MNRHSKPRIAGLAIAVVLAVRCAPGVAADASGTSAATPTQRPLHAYSPHLRAVKVVAPTHLPVSDGAAQGQLALYASVDLMQPQPQIVRAVVVVHGKLRNADRYFQTMQRAQARAGVPAASTLIVAPQFLATLDVAPNHVTDDVLRWNADDWMAGEPGAGPAPVSSYAALDSLLAQLSNRTRFPNLKEVVFAGHSGGAQVVQRYAVASRGIAALDAGDAYFDGERPNLDNATDQASPHFARYSGLPCTGFDDWKYGMKNRPPYLADRDPRALENAYVQRDITYLVGGEDDDPAHPALDKTCSAELQGPQRIARACNYHAYLQMRHPSAFHQPLYIVPGVGHDESRMLTSVCALHAMFGAPGCDQ